MRATFTVFFEGPFWVGLLEVEEADGRYSVARHVFGAEPTNPELIAFMLHRYIHVPRVHAESRSAKAACDAPPGAKRAMRLARKDAARPASTRSQAALQAGREASKKAARVSRREAGEAEAERRFSLAREKRKERHRGH